jgi:hypothetical protein
MFEIYASDRQKRDKDAAHALIHSKQYPASEPAGTDE